MSDRETSLTALRPARAGGKRRLTFDNGRYEEYQAVFVQHRASGGEWDRILIARDDGTIARLLVDLINGASSDDVAGTSDAEEPQEGICGHIHCRQRRSDDVADHPLVIKDGIGVCQMCGATGRVSDDLAGSLDMERLARAMHKAWAMTDGLGDRPEIWRDLARDTAREYAAPTTEAPPTDAPE